MREELGVHERLEVHELMMFKSLCLTKASVMKGLVTDERLKTLMQQDTEMHMRHLEDLRSHLS
ncbi:hypothetical protein [Bacillus suaedae]|uniref:Spore coat protein n=1 Tax=Halalkalibacter suaedae TaxID=2822140 RepID=A0A940WXC3_9BACI|nr:hypothetical protein [Bacillus suaedae]MBP3952233.1 hypothetical protein [Bacillus suaedae]